MAFAGVVDRAEVTRAADAVIRGPSLLPILHQVLPPEPG